MPLWTLKLSAILKNDQTPFKDINPSFSKTNPVFPGFFMPVKFTVHPFLIPEIITFSHREEEKLKIYIYLKINGL